MTWVNYKINLFVRIRELICLQAKNKSPSALIISTVNTSIQFLLVVFHISNQYWAASCYAFIV